MDNSNKNSFGSGILGSIAQVSQTNVTQNQLSQIQAQQGAFVQAANAQLNNGLAGMLKNMYNNFYPWYYIQGSKEELISRLKALPLVAKAILGLEDN